MRTDFQILCRPWINRTAIHILIHRGKTDKEIIGVCMRLARGKTHPQTLLEEIWNIKNESPSWF